MKVFRIFTSIDGEVNHVAQGIPSTFIRLAGCNLACNYCDIPEVRDPKAGIEMTPQAIVTKVAEIGCRKITITGGEPLMHKDIGVLLYLLWRDFPYKPGKPVQITVETNGSIFMRSPEMIEDLAQLTTQIPPFFPDSFGIHYVVDWKLPGSGIDESRMCVENFPRLSERDWVKFVITGRGDYEYARERILPFLRAIGCRARMAMSPVMLDDSAILGQSLAQWILTDKLWDVTLNCQIHKFLHLE